MVTGTMSVDDVWISWLDDHHGAPPKTLMDLLNYSKDNDELKTLSITEGKELIDIYKNNSKYSRRRRRKPPPPLRIRMAPCKSMDDAPSSDVSRVRVPPPLRTKFTIKPRLSETGSAHSPTPILEDYTTEQPARRSRRKHHLTVKRKDTHTNQKDNDRESDLQLRKRLRSRSKSMDRTHDIFIDLSQIAFKSKNKRNHKHTDSNDRAKSVSNVASHTHKRKQPDKPHINGNGASMDKMDKTKRTQSVHICADGHKPKRNGSSHHHPQSNREEKIKRRTTSVLMNDKERPHRHEHRHHHTSNHHRKIKSAKHKRKSSEHKTEKRERHETHEKHEKLDIHRHNERMNVYTQGTTASDTKDKRRRRTVYNLMGSSSTNTNKNKNKIANDNRRTQSVSIMIQKPTKERHHHDSHHHHHHHHHHRDKHGSHEHERHHHPHREKHGPPKHKHRHHHHTQSQKKHRKRRHRDKRRHNSNMIRTQSVTVFYEDKEDTPEAPHHQETHHSSKDAKHSIKGIKQSRIEPISMDPIRVNTIEPSLMKVGDEVLLSANREGIIRYIGKVHFGVGTWFGVELLNGSVGLHDGKVDNKRYFRTLGYRANRGIFVESKDIRRKLKHRARDRVSSPRFRQKRGPLEQIMKFEAKSQIQNTLKLIDKHSHPNKFDIPPTPVDMSNGEDTFPNN